MRRHDKEIKEAEIIQEILSGSYICRMGLVDNNEAYIVPVNYAYNDGCIYVHSASNGRKMDILRRNNNISFEIEHSQEIIPNEMPCEWSSKYRSVMGRATVSIENDPEVKKEGLNLIMKKYGAKGNLKYDEASVSRIVLLVLKITSVTGKQSGDW